MNARDTGSVILRFTSSFGPRTLTLRRPPCNSEVRQTWRRPERRKGEGVPCAVEEIKEEEIFCSYVNQISERHATPSPADVC